MTLLLTSTKRNALPLRRGGVAVCCALFGLLLLVIGAQDARAAVTFNVQVDGETRQVQLQTQAIDGVPYVSLPMLSSRLGGTAYVGTAQVQMEIRNTFAVIGINNTRVSSPNRSSIYLNHPVISRQGDVFIAASDVPALLGNIFSFQTGAASAAPEREASVEETLPQPAAPQEAAPESPTAQWTEEELDLLASLDPTPAQTEVAELEPISPEPETEPAPAPEPAPKPQPQPTPTPQTPPAQTQPAQTQPAQTQSSSVLRAVPRTIVIDAGHGGSDLGFATDGVPPEKEITLGIANRLARILKENTGLSIYQTRSEDSEMSLRARVNAVRSHEADLFISIQAGASPAPAARGVAFFYHSAPSRPDAAEEINPLQGDVQGQSRQMAEAMQARLGETGLATRGVQGVPLRVLRELAIPGVFVEAGVLSNPQDATRLASESYQEQVAQALAAGIQQLVAEAESRG